MTQQPQADAPLAGRHIAVLLGGPSSERKVSLVSGAACAEALERLGAKVSRIDPGPDVAQVLTATKPDMVFNALHGEWGEDGCVQGVLETLKLPYTHSGVLASALAMDKAKAKAVLAAAGVTVPGGGLFNRHDVARDHVLQPPYVVKPNAEGSSVGVFIIKEGANRPPEEVGAPSWTFGEEVMVEPYIQGMELAVAVLGESNGPRALAVTDIRASTGFYDYEAKYSEGGSIHVLPAPIPNAVRDRAMRMAELAHTALGCRGVTRSDFRYDDINDLLVLLEVNTQPGMTPTSLAPEQADHVGIPFDQLVLWIVEDAYARCSAGGTA
ncbi:D-alanine--D-alanine ligase [Caulobacter vibrioides]|uniref:D-alanine--D-alanine ligase n=1 Tax=Caulobacter vibrioides TaxID=155892 RepID=UPI000BB4AD57|nr:D-alanine--D-alanine ligase [Caulobacter vibrioides]ATC25531.1 D-alanine--D-alanine ligase [Caulobacter vibrioides]AZH13623.1 D-alanine--D-alanine ligase [Caulobacter vibrioides]PLR14492.1 D-alanine--D-alanine ligase [Caulobacter vibrioides]